MNSNSYKWSIPSLSDTFSIWTPGLSSCCFCSLVDQFFSVSFIFHLSLYMLCFSICIYFLGDLTQTQAFKYYDTMIILKFVSPAWSSACRACIYNWLLGISTQIYSRFRKIKCLKLNSFSPQYVLPECSSA